MKPLRIILSLLIISVTIIVTYELAKGLDFDFLDYLDKKYHFLFLTLLTQIFGVYFSSKRWKHCVESYNEGKKILFSFHTYFFLNARANIINNFLPSILFGDLSKLISPNKSKINKKTELKFIFIDRIIGVFTLLNFGLISSVYLNLISIYFLFFLILLQIICFVFIRRIEKNFLKIQSIILFFKKLPSFNVFVFSFLSQLLFSISLFIQIYAFKVSLSSIKDLFTSIFLNFMGIVPFSINGWGIREWSAAKISINSFEHDILIISSVIFGICFSISNLLIFFYTSITNDRKIKS